MKLTKKQFDEAVRSAVEADRTNIVVGACAKLDDAIQSARIAFVRAAAAYEGAIQANAQEAKGPGVDAFYGKGADISSEWGNFIHFLYIAGSTLKNDDQYGRPR